MLGPTRCGRDTNAAVCSPCSSGRSPPVARFVLPLLVLAVVIYVVYRIVTWSSD